MELETQRFYERAAEKVSDASTRKLLGDLAEAEREANRRLFVMQIVQPGLSGLMDGSVSTLAPVFCGCIRHTK
jgi:rubrerythrin